MEMGFGEMRDGERNNARLGERERRSVIDFTSGDGKRRKRRTEITRIGEKGVTILSSSVTNTLRKKTVY